MNKELVDYIKQARDQGKSDDQIIQALTNDGWSRDDISAYFTSPKNGRKSTTSPRIFLAVGGGILFLVLALLAGFIVFTTSSRPAQEEVAIGANQSKQIVESFLKERGIFDDTWIYKERTSDQYDLFDAFVPFGLGAVRFAVEKGTNQLCLERGEGEYLCDQVADVFPQKEEVPIAKTYMTPSEVYSDFRKAIIEQDFVLFRQTIAGEAEENYGFSPTESSFAGTGNSLFGGDGVIQSPEGEYDYFEPAPDNSGWLLSVDREKIIVEVGHVYLKGGSRILTMKFGDTWKIVED